MQTTDIVVVVPVYRSTIPDWEAFAFEHNTCTLANFDIVLAAPQALDCSVYTALYPGIQIRRFDDRWFRNTDTYSHFCLSHCFYEAFSQYQYLLICQLDAFVFEDQLLHWASKALDYVGPAVAIYDPTDDRFLRWITSQNGGFSLRNVKKHLQVLNSSRKINAIAAELDIHRDLGGYTARDEVPLRRTLFSLKSLVKQAAAGFASRDSASYIEEKFRPGALALAEDQYWSRFAVQFDPTFRVASLEEAQRFAIQNGLERTYSLFEEQPPFGCHGPGIVQVLHRFIRKNEQPQAPIERYIWQAAAVAGQVPALYT